MESYKPEDIVFLDDDKNQGGGDAEFSSDDLVFMDESTEPTESTAKQTIKAIPRGFWRAREMVARAGRVLGVPDDEAVEYFKGKAKGWESEDPGTIAQGVEATVTSLISTIPGLTVGTATSGPFGTVLGGSTSAGTIFSLAEYDSFMEDVEKAARDAGATKEQIDVLRKEAKTPAIISAVAEGGIEAATDMIGARIFGLFGKSVKAPAKKTLTNILGKYIKNASKLTSVEVPGEMATSAIQAQQREKAGLATASPMEAAGQAIGPSTVQSLLMAGIFQGASGLMSTEMPTLNEDARRKILLQKEEEIKSALKNGTLSIDRVEYELERLWSEDPKSPLEPVLSKIITEHLEDTRRKAVTEQSDRIKKAFESGEASLDDVKELREKLGGDNPLSAVLDEIIVNNAPRVHRNIAAGMEAAEAKKKTYEGPVPVIGEQQKTERPRLFNRAKAARNKPGFLRTADDIAALRESEQSMQDREAGIIVPEVESAPRESVTYSQRPRLFQVRRPKAEPIPSGQMEGEVQVEYKPLFARSGKPYKSKAAAQRVAGKTNGVVVPVEGGYAVQERSRVLTPEGEKSAQNAPQEKDGVTVQGEEVRAQEPVQEKQEQGQEKKEPQVIDEETYLAVNGASRQDIGEAALHKNIPEGKQRKRLLDRQAKKDDELINKRQQLRQEYQEKVDKGEIRPPTRTEKLIETANGHPDNEAVQAARRLLDKKGVNWKKISDQKPSDLIESKSITKPVVESEKGKGEPQTKPHGYVWIKEQQRPFISYREIKSGKNKGMYRVTVAGKQYTVGADKIAQWPDLDKQISDVTIGIDKQKKVADNALKKGSPTLNEAKRKERIEEAIRTGEEEGKAAGDEGKAAVRPRQGALFRKSPPKSGTSPALISRTIKPILDRWKSHPGIEVVQSIESLPKNLVDIIKKKTDGKVSGVFHDDKVYLVSDNISSTGEAQKAILHETLGHWGTRKTFGRSFDRFLRSVLAKADRTVLADIADTYGFDMEKVQDRLSAADEYVARIAESGKDPKTWSRFTSYVKQWMIKSGFTAKLSDDELRAIVKRGVESRNKSSYNNGVTLRKGPGDKTTEATPKPDGGIDIQAILSNHKTISRGNPVHAVGYRYGDAPENGFSYNTRDNKAEAGVSMASVAGLPESKSFATMSAKDRGKKYYEGDVIGYGGDDEPIMVNIRKITKRDYNKKVSGQGDASIALLADKLKTAQSIYSGWSNPFPYTGVNPHAELLRSAEDALKSKIENPNPSRSPEGGEQVRFRLAKEDLSWADAFIKDNIELKEKPKEQATEAPVSSAAKNDTLSAVEGSRLDEAAVKYLADGSTVDDYLKHIPQSIGQITINDVFKYDPEEKQYISTITDKDGKLKPAIRQSGFYALKEFSDYFKGKKDISKREGMWSDVTRMIQAIDGGKFGGMAQKFILWPSRSTILAKVKWTDTKKMKVADIQDKYNLDSGKKAKAFGDVSEFIPDAGVSTNDILAMDEVQGHLKGFTEKEKREIVEAAKEGRRLYDELIDEQNKARKQIGRKEIGYLENYKPHVRDANIWSATFGSRAKIKDIMESPELPDFIQPNQPFNPRAMARENGLEGYAQERNGIRLLADYVETAAKDIFHTNVIQNNKIHAAVLRSHGIENGANAVDAWTAEVFAGVSPRITRVAKEVLHPKIRGGILSVRRNLTRAVFPLNWSWNLFVQTSSAGITFARYGTKANIAGLKYFTDPALRKLIREQAYSLQIKSRWSGSLTYQDVGDSLGAMKRLEASRIDKVEDFLNYFTRHLEEGLTGHAIAAAYYQGKKLGLKGRELMEYASEGGAKTQSMYNLQDIPGLLRAKEVGAIAPFQTFAFEMFNTVREMNLPILNKVVGKTGAYETMSANTAEGKALLSNRLKMVARLMAVIAVTNAVAQHAIDRDLWSMSAFIPFWGLITGDTWGMPTPIKYVKDFLKGAENILVYGNMRKFRQWFLRYHIMAGIQIERTIEGIEAVIKGGVDDVSGRRQYNVEGPAEQIKAVTMGPAKTEAGREHYKGYNKPAVKRLFDKMSSQGQRRQRKKRPERRRRRD